MKRTNKKLLTLMLTGALCAVTMGVGAIGLTNASADEAPAAKKYSLTDIFRTSGATVSAEKIGDETAETATFTFKKDGESVEFNRDLAYKWYDAAEAKYLNYQFSFKALNFTDVSFVFETAPAQATKDDKASNTVKFAKGEGDVISASVLNGETEQTAVALSGVGAGTDITLSLSAGDSYGEFKVNVNGTQVGVFKNVGSNFADTSSVDTLVVKANGVTGDEGATVYWKALNGQAFNNIVTESDKKMVTDNAAPVLVVNDEVGEYLLGTAFDLDYEKIDVLKSSSITETKKYYQWNPADTEAMNADETAVDTDAKYTGKLSVGTSGTYFMDTVYYTNGTEYSKEAKEGYEKTSVYREEGQEYVSICIQLDDGTFTGDTQAKYFLHWYAADSSAVATKTLKDKNGADVETKYIIFNRNEKGAEYTNVTLNDTEFKNELVQEWENVAGYAEFLEELAENAKEVYAGSNAKLEIPSVEWMIEDNNGYQALNFTISYRTPSSSTAQSSSNLDYDELKIAAENEGKYEFKIFATDAAGNAMKYYLDGELVSVSTANVWDIEEIPSFTFDIRNQGIKADDGEDTDTLDSQILDETYTMSDIKIVGVTTKKSDFALYKLNLDAYNQGKDADDRLTVKDLAGINFSALKEGVDAKLSTVTDGNYFELYKTVYIEALAKAIGATADEVKVIFPEKAIEADSDNKYNWQPSARSFKAAEEGLYIILADYWDAELAYVNRVAAYQLVEVEAEADVIKGETEWLKNNLVSVILFSVAAVMLVLIIVLLLIKPTDETLEDVDAKAKAKKNATTKKNK